MWHQEAIDNAMELLIRANKAAILSEALAFFGTSKRRAEVYLAADGNKTVSAIAESLRMKGPNVTRDLSLLKDFGLIEVNRMEGSSIVYKKRRIDRIIGLSSELRKKFELSAQRGESPEQLGEKDLGPHT